MPQPLCLEWADFDREPDNGAVQGPTRDDVRSILVHLDGGEEGFVILSEAEEHYVQTAFRDGDPEEGFVVEYRGAGVQFELDEGFVPVERVLAIFEEFFTTRKRPAGEWVEIDF